MLIIPLPPSHTHGGAVDCARKLHSVETREIRAGPYTPTNVDFSTFALSLK